MDCLYLALQKSGIKVDNYYASEIDKQALRAVEIKHPEAVQLGDVCKLRLYLCTSQLNRDLMYSHENTSKETKETILLCNEIVSKKIDLIGSGSPCQGFSFAGKGLAFNDPRSKLFFEFVRIYEFLKKLNPNIIFLLENVRMKKEHEDVISRILGIQPLIINSALLSAQNRTRLYWCNICTEQKGLFSDPFCAIPQPKDL